MYKVLNVVIQLHEDQLGKVGLNSDLSEPFPITNGVKQGCALVPTLFTIFFSMVLKPATEDLDDEDCDYIRYCLDGSLFNLRRLQARTKTLEQLIRDLLFTDDAALAAHTERALQYIKSCFADAARFFVLEVSLKKDGGPPPTCPSGVEQQTPEEEHQDQRLQGCRTYHPPIWLGVVGHLPQPSTTP